MTLQPAYCARIHQYRSCRSALTGTYLGEDGLNSRSVVGLPVTLSTLGTDADEVADSIVGVLGMAFLENTSGAVEKWRSLLDGSDAALSEGPSGVGALEDVALNPRVDSDGATGKNGCAVLDADGNGDVVELDVVEDDGSVEMVAWRAVSDEDRRICYDCVDDSLRANTLSATFLGASLTLRNVNTDL